MKKNLYIVLLLLGLPFSAFSQNAAKAWTLQDCIEYALKNNIQVKQSELNAELSKAVLLQSEARLLPSLNGNIAHNYNFGRTIDPFTNQFATDRVLSQNFSVSSSLTIFSGLQQINAIRQSKFDYLASRYDVDKMRNDISMNIALAYLQVLYSEELVDVTKAQAEITEAQVERTKKLVEAGSLARGSLLEIQAQLATEELNLANAQNQLDLSYLSLAQLLDLQWTPEFRIVKPDLNIPAETVIASTANDIFNAALSIQPDIKSAEFRMKSSYKGLAVARGGISPRIVFSGSVGTGYSGIAKRLLGTPAFNGFDTIGVTSGGDLVMTPSYTATFETTPFSDQVNDNFNQSFGVFITIPIFNGLQTKTNISRAKISMQNAEYSLQLAKNQLQKNVQQAYADASAGLKKYFAAQKAVDAMEESFKYTQQRYDVGMVNTIDYNTSKNNLTKAKSDLVQAKYDYVFRTKVLDFYQGKPLSF
jgi:outer membrane protein